MTGSKGMLPLGALAVLGVLVVPVAIATAGGNESEPEAVAAASVKKKLKKLKQRVAALEAQIDTPGPPSGLAGGDLTDSYPDPSIRAGVVNSAKVANDSLAAADIGPNAVGPSESQNIIRSVNLPLGSFVSTTGSGALLDFAVSDGTSADFVCQGSCGFAPLTSSFVLRWDDDSDGSGGPNVADTTFVSSTLTVPSDYGSDGSFAVRASKDGHGGVGEEVEAGVTVAGAFEASDSVPITTATNATYTLAPAAGYAPGESVSVALAVSTVEFGVQNTSNDQVDLHSVEFRYTSVQ